VLAALPSGLYRKGTLSKESQRLERRRLALADCPMSGRRSLEEAKAMQSILDETQDVELLWATALTAAGYLIGAVVFLTALF